MRKIMASDYDGTLNQGGISSETIEAIKKWQRKGNLFGIVTGRDFVNGFEYFTKEFSFPFDFIISHNGAVAVDCHANVLCSRSAEANIPWNQSTLLQELIKDCLELSKNRCGVSFEKTRLDFHPDSLKGIAVRDDFFSPLSVLKEVERFNLANAICDNDEEAAFVTKCLREKYGAYVNPIQNGRCIDISPAGVDKCTGIDSYAEYMRVEFDNIWTAGDNYNDISMLKKYHGCAMTSGVESAREAAEYVCDSVADAIETALKK